MLSVFIYFFTCCSEQNESSHNISDIVCHSAGGGHIGKIFDDENDLRRD